MNMTIRSTRSVISNCFPYYFEARLFKFLWKYIWEWRRMLEVKFGGGGRCIFNYIQQRSDSVISQRGEASLAQEPTGFCSAASPQAEHLISYLEDWFPHSGVITGAQYMLMEWMNDNWSNHMAWLKSRKKKTIGISIFHSSLSVEQWQKIESH